jgi:hypothetical protein
VIRAAALVSLAFASATACHFPHYEYAACDPGACDDAATDAATDGAADTAIDAATEAGIALDALALVDGADAGPQNLVDNPGCEDGVAPWTGYQATVTCDPTQHHSGAKSFLCTCTSANGGFYTIQHPDPLVKNPPAGKAYLATAWVRSSSTVGTTVNISIRLQGGSSPDAEVQGVGVAMATDWKQVSVTVLIDAPDRTQLSGYVVQYQAGVGQSFNMDDFSIVEQ